MLPPTVQTRSTWSALISYHPSGQRASAVAMTGQAVGSPVPGSAGHGRQLLSGTASGGGRSGGRGSPPALTINFRARGSAAEHHQQREGGQAGNTSQQFWSDDAGLVRTSAAAAAAVASSGGAAGVLISAAVSAPPQSSGISVSPAAQLHSPRSAPGGPSRRAITQPAGSQTSDGAPSPTPSAAAAGGMRRPDGAAQAGTPDAAAGPAHSQAPAARNSSNSMHPQFRSKAVCKLTCVACEATVCSRGMKAILLADTRVELYSTDTPPIGVQLVNDDYMTRNCKCKIRDVACLGCGSVVGYHVTMPCSACLDACNNGHFWMFHAEGIRSADRMDPTGTKALLWASILCVEKDRHGFEGEGEVFLCR